MNVAYSCNDFYIQHTGVSIISLCVNNKDVDEINIFFIAKDVSESNIKRLSDIVKSYQRNFAVYDFDEIGYDLNISAIGRHIETIYAKIFFERLPVDKILYLDSDTVINGSLVPLWETDLSHCYMGVVETTSVECKKKLGIKDESVFFNDGMTLVNVDYCRKHNLLKECLKLISKFNGNPPVLSEGILNVLCQDHVVMVSPKYNMMSGIYQLISLDSRYAASVLSYSEECLVEAKDNPVVIHYLTGFYNRPWFSNCSHPLKQKYIEYLRLSPWKNYQLEYKKMPIKLKILNFILNLLGPKLYYTIRQIIKFK